MFKSFSECISLLTQLQSPNDTWSWLRKVLLPGLYYTETYSNKPVSDYDLKFISNGYAMRLGPPRIRQLRVIPGTASLEMFNDFEFDNIYFHGFCIDI